MSRAGILTLLLVAHVLAVIPFTQHLRSRPAVIKLGYLPSAKVMKLAAPEFAPLLAQVAVARVMIYYGSLFQENPALIQRPPEVFNMFKTIERAIQLDPYNMDAYYFAQATFTWEIGRAKDVNQLLKHGVKYRIWDWQLPYYVGFNAAYFLQDYATAATYMKQAAEISGYPFFSRLAARYLSDAGQTDMAIAYLEAMIKEAKDETIRELYLQRLESLLEARRIEPLVEQFRQGHGRLPIDITELVQAKLLEHAPDDYLGREFVITSEGRVVLKRNPLPMEKIDNQ